MFPPTQGLHLDIDAVSQICGSVSIACWIVVFSPQIIENWRRGSAEGLSVVFITIWLLGDFFNIFGAVMQGVLPTMTILAVYYTLADIVLLGQCFWYKGFTLKDEVTKPASDETDEEETSRAGASNGSGPSRATESSPLLSDERRTYASVAREGLQHGQSNGHAKRPTVSDIDRRHSAHSTSSLRERFLAIDGSHLSPVTPMISDFADIDTTARPNAAPAPRPQASTLQTILFNAGAVVLVIFSGIFGWWLSTTQHPISSPALPEHPPAPPTLHFNAWGQVFGYICALLYLGSRIPQLLLNYRRKSTDGISMLFFLFACIGNLTYVLSILAYKPVCRVQWDCEPGEKGRLYARYIAVNASWLIGSFGTLVLDAGVFVQYFLYRKEEESGSEGEESDGVGA